MKRKCLPFLLALFLLGVGAQATIASEPDLPPLPPLNDPASGVNIPGKFIWTDIVTSDIATARKFYADVFGWEWRWVSEHPEHLYGMFYKDDIAVAGVAQRAAADKKKAYARWVYYISTGDVAAAIKATTDRGGRVLLPIKNVANRGEFAVLADPENAPFGVMNSSSGDTPDYRAEIGHWLWVGFYSRNAENASKFYGSVFGYDAQPYDDDHRDIVSTVLVAGGYARAAIGELHPDSESKPTWIGFVRVVDLAATLERARAAGAEVMFAPEEGVEGDIAVIADPLGAPVGLMTWTFEEEDKAEEEAQR